MRVCPVAVLPVLLTAAACASGPAARPSPASVSAAPTLGRFVWHDLSTDDLPAAQRFYGGLLGWDFCQATRHEHVDAGSMVHVDEPELTALAPTAFWTAGSAAVQIDPIPVLGSVPACIEYPPASSPTR